MKTQTEFKLTSIGEIPKKWEVVKLGDNNIVELIMGQSPPSSTYNEKGEGLPFLQGKIEFGEIYPSPTIYCSNPIKIAEPNDILLSVRAPVGDVNIARCRCCIGRGLSAIRAKQDKLHHLFLFYYLKLNGKKFEALSVGSTFKAIRRQEIENYLVPSPSIPEQRKIAKILSTVDESIQKVDEAIAKTERLKRGLMQELLTKGIGHEEFKDTEIGRIPKGWDVVYLRGVVENENYIVAGPFGSNLKVSDYRSGGVPIIRLQNIERNQFIRKDIKYISIEKANELKYHSFESGDLVLAKLGDPIGKTCIVPPFMEKGIVVADVVRIRVSPEKANTKFIEYMLNSFICFIQLRKETIGSTRPRVNITQVRNLKFPLPGLKEQQKIASIISTVDKKLELERKRKEKLGRIKRGLMNDMLTGKKRVKVVE